MKNISILILFSLFFTNGFSQIKNFIDQPYLETNAKADTLVTPDNIYLTILLTEKDSKGKISIEELANKMALHLKSLGINLEEQLKLSDLASNFKKYFLKQQDILKSKSYTLLIHDAITTGKVIIGLEKIGISNVHLEKLEYSKLEDLKLILRSKAILKAKMQGEALLIPVNQNLGKIIHLVDYNRQIHRALDERIMVSKKYSENDKFEEPIDIQFDKIKVQSEINVKFIIE